MKLIRNLIECLTTTVVEDLPPIGWWAKCAYTNQYHRIVAHDLISAEPMDKLAKEKLEGVDVYEP